ncbi:MAG: hypothetical protein BMS9Abin26_1283 [Gammaproteobacteria bacterium]|nr:MAG: hypothetical protein BMS9Abin26_1283 [Gammaproteobacteria bacterium]
MDDLTCTIAVDDEQQLILVKASGHLNGKNAEKTALRSRELALQHGYGVLLDYLDLRLDASIIELYEFPRSNPIVTDKARKGVRVAVLIARGEDVDNWRFYEATSRNMGVNVKVFIEDEATARVWVACRTN